MSTEYDPAKTPCPPLFHVDPECYSLEGPGGRTTNVENNEKGILESDLFQHMANGTQASLRSAHDGYRMGIYITNSMGDND